MNKANLTLSGKEMEIITNADWILTKNDIIKKTVALMGMMQDNQQQFLMKAGKHLPAEALEISPKISKGENYKGLPYLVLDYPRVFDKKNIFAIRTLFWWGNFFSITLHLSGKYKKRYEQNILTAFSAFKKTEFSLCINKNEWEHHFEESNYVPFSQLSKADVKQNLSKNSFIKLAKKKSIEEWNMIPDILCEDFKKIIEMLKN